MTFARQLRAGSALQALALLGAGAMFCTPALAQSSSAVTPDQATPAQAGQPDASQPGAAAVAVQNSTEAGVDTDATSSDIVVTGTLFRRTDTETPSPVSVLTAATLDQRGITSVADAVQTISAGNGGNIPQGFGGAFAAGSQAISLRGLTTNSTLTLFDGLRAANYPLADDGQRSFVDLNTIPQAIVERIEVLRDGASATYGADAVAGVVNVILKKEIQGVVGRVEGGISDRGDRGNQRMQLTAGYGSLADQGFNFYLSGEYQHEDQLFNRDRAFPYNTNNLSSIDAGNGFTGRNGNFGFTPPTTGSTSGATVAIARPATYTPGNILSGIAVAGGQFGVLGTGGCAAGGLNTRSTTSGTYCEQDLVNQFGVILPKQERFGGTGHLTFNVGDKAQAYVVGTFYENHVTSAGTPSSIRSSNPISTLGIVLPATLTSGALNPQNPYAAQGQGALLYYRFGDIANSTDIKAKSYRFAAGVDGTIGDDWGYSVAGVYMRTNLHTERTGFINLPGLTTAVNTGTYNFFNPAANTDATRALIAPLQTSDAHSELAQGQVTITKPLFQLPGGPLQVGVGGQFRYENIYDPNADTPLETLNINTFEAIGHRYVTAGFFEINAPVLDQLEVNASGRYDHYSEGFSHFSPKIGAKFTPIQQIAIRGTYSEGFRAPSIPEVSGAVIGFVGYTPPASVQGAYGNNAYITTPYNLGLFASGNPDLKPETSKSFTGGFVVQPKSWLSLTADFYYIKKKNLIIPGIGADASAADAYLAGGALPSGVTITPNPVDPENPNLPATPFSVNALYANGQSLKTTGIDAQLQATIPLGDGVKFTSLFEGTVILKYTIDTGTDKYNYVGTIGSYNITSASGTPKYRANWQNTIEAGPYSLSGTVYYTDGYYGYADDYLGSGCENAVETSIKYNAAGTGGTAGPALQCRVKKFISVDLTGQVKVTDNFTFYVNALNVLDAKAPFDPNTYGGNNYNPAWSQSGVIGRAFRAGATFKF